MATVSIAGVHKSFGKTKAVDDLSVDIADGEFFVILGPSGAGKTTTLKSVAGLVDIDAGAIHIGGTDVTRVEPYHRNVAMAFESYALYPQKTVAENLASPLKSGRTGQYTEAQRAERIDQVTTTLGINHLRGMSWGISTAGTASGSGTTGMASGNGNGGMFGGTGSVVTGFSCATNRSSSAAQPAPDITTPTTSATRAAAT